MRSLRLTSPSDQEVWLVPAVDAISRGVQRMEPFELEPLLSPFGRRHADASALRRFVLDGGLVEPGALRNLSNERLLELVRGCVRRGLVVGLRSRHQAAPEPTPAKAVLRVDEPPAITPAARPRQDDWIEIIVEREDGSPFEGTLHLELPDGRRREVSVGREGLVRLDGIAPGTVKVTIPSLDAGSWN